MAMVTFVGISPKMWAGNEDDRNDLGSEDDDLAMSWVFVVRVVLAGCCGRRDVRVVLLLLLWLLLVLKLLLLRYC